MANHQLVFLWNKKWKKSKIKANEHAKTKQKAKPKQNKKRKNAKKKAKIKRKTCEHKAKKNVKQKATNMFLLYPPRKRAKTKQKKAKIKRTQCEHKAKKNVKKKRQIRTATFFRFFVCFAFCFFFLLCFCFIKLFWLLVSMAGMPDIMLELVSFQMPTFPETASCTTSGIHYCIITLNIIELFTQSDSPIWPTPPSHAVSSIQRNIWQANAYGDTFGWFFT